MTMTSGVRKLTLTMHVTCAVGWAGAVAGSLALGVAALNSSDPQLVRGAYLLLRLTGWSLLVPLSLASLTTGLILALGTRWGLFRHYWVLFSFLMNVFAAIVLLRYMQTLGEFASLVANPTLSDADILDLRSPSPVVHASAALLFLLVAITLSIYKPQGVTPFGRQDRTKLAVKELAVK
jgi:hypothetical protein